MYKKKLSAGIKIKHQDWNFSPPLPPMQTYANYELKENIMIFLVHHQIKTFQLQQTTQVLLSTFYFIYYSSSSVHTLSFEYRPFQKKRRPFVVSYCHQKMLKLFLHRQHLPLGPAIQKPKFVTAVDKSSWIQWQRKARHPQRHSWLSLGCYR
jgi:hypothetical protein